MEMMAVVELRLRTLKPTLRLTLKLGPASAMIAIREGVRGATLYAAIRPKRQEDGLLPVKRKHGGGCRPVRRTECVIVVLFDFHGLYVLFSLPVSL